LERLVVENPQNWKDVSTNIPWLTAAIDTLKSLTYNDNPPYTPPYEPDMYSYSKVGIRTSASDWQQITGGSTEWGNKASLW